MSIWWLMKLSTFSTFALAHDPVSLNAFFQQFHIRLFLQALVLHFDFT